jgi:hypothetical protein
MFAIQPFAPRVALPPPARVRLAQGGLAHPVSPLCSAQQRSRRVGRECERFSDRLRRSRLGDDGGPRLVATPSGGSFVRKRKRTPSSFNRRAMAECSGLSGLQSRLAEEKSNASSRSIASAASRATTSAPNRCKAECKVRAASGCPSMSGVACPLRKCRSTSPFVPARSLSLTALIVASAVRHERPGAPIRHVRRQENAMHTWAVTGTRALRARCQ